MLDRIGQRADLGVLIIEQVTDALLFISVRPGSAPSCDRIAVQVVDDTLKIRKVEDLLMRCQRGDGAPQQSLHAYSKRPR